MQPEILYAVYPGSVTLRNGIVRTFTAAELATVYGVQNEPYLVVNSDLDLPRDPEAQMRYIHLKPRPDNYYENIKDVAQDDGQPVTWGLDFDGTKQWTDETDPLNIDDEYTG